MRNEYKVPGIGSGQWFQAVAVMLLVVGGAIGAQFGVRMASRLRGEQLRLLLAILVLAVGLRLLYGLVATPNDLYTLALGGS